VGGDQLDNSQNGAGAVYVFSRSDASWTQSEYIKSPAPDMGDELGIALAMSGDGGRLWASAYFEDSAARGVDGDVFDNSAPESGAVFELEERGTWTHHRYLKASNTQRNGGFGLRIAASRDGRWLAVGALGDASAATGFDGDETDTTRPFAGAVFLFEYSVQRHYVKATTVDAGDELVTPALSGDGSVLAVGAYLEDSAARGVGGDQTDNAAMDSGAVFVYW
jgi:hypothetical protein